MLLVGNKYSLVNAKWKILEGHCPPKYNSQGENNKENPVKIKQTKKISIHYF